jgi:uncharacterized protein
MGGPPANGYTLTMAGSLVGSRDVVALVLVILVCAVVQSVFGVGLLVFGTPTLLLMGYGFDQALAYLLPCSLAISALQLASRDGLRLDPLRRQFLVYTAPAVLASTLFVLLVLPAHTNLKPAVGVMLLATALLRAGRLRTRPKSGIRRHLTPLLVGLGLLHGATNLGGGVLTAMMSELHDTKEATRRQIAFCYGLMASIQLTVLAITKPDVQWNLLLPVLAATAFLAVGRRVFARTREVTYQHAMTGLIAAYGILLVTNP